MLQSLDFLMAEKEGFEPSRACTPIGVRDRPLQPLGYFSSELYYINLSGKRKVLKAKKNKHPACNYAFPYAGSIRKPAHWTHRFSERDPLIVIDFFNACNKVLRGVAILFHHIG